MSPRFAALALFPVFLLIGGCGGGGSSSSSSSTAVATATTSGAAASSSTSTSTTSTASSSKKPKHFATGSSNVRIPVTLKVLSGGRLSPPQISIPAKLPVEVTITAADHRPHRVVMTVTPKVTLTVPASGRTSARIGALKVGRYPIELDGRMAGLLVTGATPGP